MPIRLLPPLVINQIAAGEVVERPASVVKELLENAIDAGATRLSITIEAGGTELIEVNDDGAGIPFDEIGLAIAPHATSKIDDAGDLEHISTLGFRGEALASIASVSRMTLRSRRRGSDSGGVIEVDGDSVRGPRPAGGPAGTTVTVRNLFFNTPARRKFLKTYATETGRINRVVGALALGHAHLNIKLTVNDRVTLDLVAAEPRRRIIEVLGSDLEGELIEIESKDRGVGISGMIGRPGVARPTPRHLHLFLNGRPINDRSVVHAVREGYRGLIDPQRHPTLALFLEMDPAEVDVNVHPAKTEIRFRNQSIVHEAVRHTIRDALGGENLVATFDLDRVDGVDRVGRGPAVRPQASGGTPQPFFGSGLEPKLPTQPIEILPPPRMMSGALQVHRKYIVAEDDAGLMIIDQHALHERVMFERLANIVETGSLERQRLLTPATVEMDASRQEHLEPLQPLLERIGIEVSPIGPDAVAIHAFPSLLFERGVKPDEFVAELFERASCEGIPPDPEAALHEVLDMMACKAAIKAGDALTPTEVADLLGNLDRVERSSRCPHGRPTTLRMTIADLDRRFGR